MKKINAIIVDDEQGAVNTLRGMLQSFCPQVVILEEAHSIDTGFQAIQRHAPQLVFLDIEIPPLGQGFDLLKMTPNRNFGVIFTTAYPQYAIQAINKAQPWGYLVKPYRVSDLVQAVLLAEERIQNQLQEAAKVPDHQGIIISDSRKGNVILHIKDILYCQADSGTTDIYFVKQDKVEKITASSTLKEIEQQLPEQLFCRTHHSFVVNLRHIIRYQKTGRNGVIYLPFQKQVDISVLKMEQFEEKFRRLLQQ